MRWVEAGNAVLQSITTVPGRKPCSTPAAPVSTSSTWGEPVNTRITTSDRAATSAALCRPTAPAAFRASSGWFPGCSSTVSAWPCFNTLLAMPWPIRPIPTMPTFMLMSFS